MKLDIFIKKGTHSTEDEINKQINDRERVAAAIENQNLWKLVENCINEDDWTRFVLWHAWGWKLKFNNLVLNKLEVEFPPFNI